MHSEGFRVGDYWIEWCDEETLSITDTRLGQNAVLHGGDFESILASMVNMACLSVREAVS